MIKVLSYALICGEVIIITNANNNWIAYTLTNFFPSLLSFITQQNILFLSAYELFSSSSSTSNPLNWKLSCFHEIINTLQMNYNISHLISIGDGLHEKIACQTISTHFSIPYNIIQFLSIPSPGQLLQQLSLLLIYIQSILFLKSNIKGQQCRNHQRDNHSDDEDVNDNSNSEDDDNDDDDKKNKKNTHTKILKTSFEYHMILQSSEIQPLQSIEDSSIKLVLINFLQPNNQIIN